MASKKLALLVLEHRNKYYKISTLTMSKDGSVHIINHFSQGINEDGNHYDTPSKYTYHTSGLAHFTFGSGASKEELFPKNLSPHKDIEDTVGMMSMVVKDVNIKRAQMFDDFLSFKSYKNVFTLRSKEYNHLLIKYYMANKNFDIRNSADNYKEVFQVKLPNNLLLISTENGSNYLDMVMTL